MSDTPDLRNAPRNTDTNVMRHTYRQLTAAELGQIKSIKDRGLDFIGLLDDIGGSREMSLAKTKIEEAVFWAVKHITY